MRYVTGLVILIAASMACSRGNDRSVAALPTSPTGASLKPPITYVGGVSGPMDVLFPGRNESFQFRNDLETKYATGLGRAAAGTFVDREGEVVWMQEYIRYRVNGCDHATAMARVLTQIDGGAAGGICAAPPEGLILFPPRNDMFDARRMLETKYQQMGRGLSPTSVDPEGSAIWITDTCAIAPTRAVTLTPSQKVFIADRRRPGAADVLRAVQLRAQSGRPQQRLPARARSPSKFARLPARRCAVDGDQHRVVADFASDFTPGSGFTTVPYTIATNNGGDRSGPIDVAWQGGSARYTVDQAGSPFAASLYDDRSVPLGGTPITECHFRSASTPCILTRRQSAGRRHLHLYVDRVVLLRDAEDDHRSSAPPTSSRSPMPAAAPERRAEGHGD